MTKQSDFSNPQGLYNAQFEHDSCGVGFVAHIKGRRSHQIIQDANTVLINMTHRGACGCETNTGDGAGMLTALPHEFLSKVAKTDLGIELHRPGHFAAGLVFLPTRSSEYHYCKQTVERIVATQGQTVLGWRTVPTDPDGADIGQTARRSMPTIEQLLVGAADGLSGEDFERKLYLIRKQASALLRNSDLEQALSFYFCSLSTKVMVYKGMLTPAQVLPFYTDLCDPDYTSHLAMVHSRFSTNTFPSWDRAQPNRFMAHNGEINTLRGNKNWMRAREGVAQSEIFGEQLRDLFPVIEAEVSDSGAFDNALEFMLMNGRSLQAAVMMMVPEAWENHATMSAEKKAFYEYHSCLMEPWDGPASIAFTDGRYIGAVLDRNGLRPSRYYLTHDDRVIMASEVGVLDVAPDNVKAKGRLQPGRMFLVDFEQGRLIPDDELKHEFSTRRPYGEWLNNQRMHLDHLHAQQPAAGLEAETLLARMQAFGYTTETLQFMLLPMVRERRDPLGAMGNDSALACLSDEPRLVYDYFKQLFAQVTNPAIDSIREEIIMSLECYIGPEGNLLETTEARAQRLRIPHPVLSNEQLTALKHIDQRGWRSQLIDITFPCEDAHADGLVRHLERICAEAEAAIAEGYSLVVLSDRAVGPDRIAISALLATGAVHHHLVRTLQRTRLGLIVETGEAREVHHHCLLIGYGADAVNPYLAYEALWQARRDGLLDDSLNSDEAVVTAYRKGAAKGMLKVMAKMGISTLHSYKGAQIFEAVGLEPAVIERCFVGTASRIRGCGFGILATEALRRHDRAYPPVATGYTGLHNPGEFHWRANGETHAWNPEVIANIQAAARTNSREAYRHFAELADADARKRGTLRGLLRLKPAANGASIPLEEVEPASEIVKRFCTGAMSLGAISTESHEALALAMNRMGGKSNTGEGGEDAVRYRPLPNGDSKRSAIKQVASGRFGVNIHYLTNADELQIKVAQGAKPGEGGELPGHKVDQYIARLRHSTPGVGLISPPPHHDIYSIEDLAQLIFDLKNANPAARVSVKLVSEVGVGTIAAGVSKAHADHILISGHDGGTGASPLTSIKHAGLPWELGLAETHQTLVMNDLRSRVTLQTDGQMKTGRDVVIAALLGAEEYGFSTAPLIVLGCIMMRKCHLNTCPVGIATQDPALRKKFAGDPEHVVNYLFMVAEEARQHMASMGFRTINEMIGRTDALETDSAFQHWKADGLDLSAVLSPARKPHPDVEVYCTIAQDHGLDQVLDQQLVAQSQAALNHGSRIRLDLPIKNTDRCVGGILSHTITKQWGEAGLPDDTIHLKFTGSAGQSLGAWLARGVNIELEGDANDYVGKGLSGGRIIVYPSPAATFVPEDNIIVGNVCLYGAVTGEVFIRGIAAERFAVRNSGAIAVVEGVGDHGCEYMTGGRVVILGPTGRNFAAGMSGGITYVWDPEDQLRGRCNLEMVELEALLDDPDIHELRTLIERHKQFTGSAVAARLLADWPQTLRQFIKVMPTDYKRVLMQQQRVAAQAA